MARPYTRSLSTLLIAALMASPAISQKFFKHSPKATHWVDSVFNSLSPDQRLAQLMVVRESSIKDGKPVIFTDEVLELVKKYNIGGICLFQGSPEDQARALHSLQAAAKTPLMVCIDGESGLGMRMQGVQSFPDQLTMGAMRHAKDLVYQIGQAMGRQCTRMGVQVNYAPVVDINNNPDNPVIGYRSFGQDKQVVADYGVAIMKGMQDVGIMACAKHFPGHGDVAVDSHLDLPVINKSLDQLEQLELYPFKQIFKAGIGSVMIAHLSIPKIDSTPHLASSLSHKFVTDLLRNKVGFQGLSFTDALEMQGVAKFFPRGVADVMSLQAGNDMLCLPGDVALSIQKINEAVDKGVLNRTDLDQRVKKVLYAKYHLNLDRSDVATIEQKNIDKELNKEVAPLSLQVARRSLTAVRIASGEFQPLQKTAKNCYLQIGGDKTDLLGTRLEKEAGAKHFYFDYHSSQAAATDLLEQIKAGGYDRILISIGGFSKRPANNFNLSQAALDLVSHVQEYNQTATLVVMGNPYALKNFTKFHNLLVSYEDGNAFQQAVADFMVGLSGLSGKLPVTVAADMPYGQGLVLKATKR